VSRKAFVLIGSATTVVATLAVAILLVTVGI